MNWRRSGTPWAVVFLQLCCGTLARTATSTATKQCAKAGLPAPQVSTLMVSPTNGSVAWILHPNCELDVIPTVTDNSGDAVTELHCTEKTIKRIASLPKAQRLYLDNTAITEADFTSPPGIIHIILAWCNLAFVDDFKFPTSLTELDFEGNNLQGIAKNTIPQSVKTLYIGENALRSVKNISLPDSLEYLSFKMNKLTAVDFPIPKGLLTLELSGNRLANIENFTMPDSLTQFLCADCNTKSFRGVQLSSDLETLDLGGSTLSRFEIRESDVSIMKKLSISGTITQTKCGSGATLVAISSSVSICVLSDDQFEATYALRVKPSVPSQETTQSPVPTPTETTAPPAPSSTGAPSTANTSAASSTSTMVTIIAVVTGIVCVAVAAIFYRVFCSSRTKKSSFSSRRRSSGSDRNKYVDAGMAPTLDLQGISSSKTHGSSGYASQEYLTNDVRNDEELIPFRIAYDEVAIIKVIAKGGFGVIHLGKIRGRDVAVKTLRPERSREMGVLKSFMDEIRICAKLDHPKIVAFVGIAWNTLLDMAVVIEYMQGGDLLSVLSAGQVSSKLNHWFESTGELKAKSLLALDVIEGLVYLHSFHSPIIHRDLKAKNVLLTGEGDAKLADFGISREVPMDETMTGEVGTVAWIAPEVLQGERYSEKADIYSFGVVLVELDTGRHPYSQLYADKAARLTNPRMALLISTGQLHPPMSEACPSPVLALAERCLGFCAEDRPTAIGIHYELRKMLQQRGSQSGQIV